jgi:hypothetical protein
MNEFERLLNKQDEAMIGSIFSRLITEQDRAVLPESIFVEYFLPYFSGRTPVGTSKVLPDWISVAGSTTSEVDIISPSGAVLFTTPGLFDTSIFDPMAHLNTTSIANIHTGYEMRQTNLPMAAKSYWDQSIARVDVMGEEIDRADVTQRWMDIFARYGIEPITGTSVPKSKVEYDLSDDIEYD